MSHQAALPSYNPRPSFQGQGCTLQAAVLLCRLARWEAFVARRRAIAQFYDQALEGLVELPLEAEGCRDVYYVYTIRTDRRDELAAFLAGRGIETRVRHPVLMPHQPAYADLPGRDWPVASRLVERILSLPCHERMTDLQVERVASAIQEFFRS